MAGGFQEGAFQEDKPHCARTNLPSVYIMLADAPLIKASHMAKININRMVKYILLIVDHDKGGGGKEEL